MRAAFAALGAVLGLLAACQSAPQSRPSAAERPFYTLVDLADDYSAFYDRTAALDPQARVAAFKADIVPLFPAFYGQARYPNMTQERYDARIARSFEAFAALRPAYEQAEANFTNALAPALGSFRAVFPDMAPIGPIYLVHSLGEMDGGTRAFGGRNYFIFGADVMARLHAPGSERPFFHHELFHVYHFQSFRTCGTVWCSLWAEGLATYAASTLNPDATDAQLLLNVPEPIRAAVDANLAEAVCTVKARLNSSDDADMRALFSFSRLNERLPPRFGYYVGFLVAQEAARTSTLRDLARMDNRTAAPIVDAALAALATCPAI